MIDYYLKPGLSGPVTLDIVDADGNVRMSFSSDPAATAANGAAAAAGRGGRAGGGGIPNTTALWRPTPEPFSGVPGMHRVAWSPAGGGGRGGGGGAGRGGRAGGAAGAALSSTGMFTAKLTVNGKSYSQTFTMKPDPRAR